MRVALVHDWPTRGSLSPGDVYSSRSMQKRIASRGAKHSLGFWYSAQRNSRYGPGGSTHRKQTWRTFGQEAPDTSTISSGHGSGGDGTSGSSSASPTDDDGSMTGLGRAAV